MMTTISMAGVNWTRPQIWQEGQTMEYRFKGLPDYSEESIIREIQRVAAELGKNTLTSKEFNKYSRTDAGTVHRRIGSWNVALKKAGLSLSKEFDISNEELLQELDRFWKELRRPPKSRDMDQEGRFSSGLYRKRFGGWAKAMEALVDSKKASDHGVSASIPDAQKLEEGASEGTPRKKQIPTKSKRKKRGEYGEPIDFRGLRHAPVNEQGVVFMFGILSHELGFIIEAVRTGFPDCEGKRKVPGKAGRWERVAIEFEYKSSNFKEHDHNVEECDIIVCWENDWKDCPIEVISLREMVRQPPEEKT